MIKALQLPKLFINRFKIQILKNNCHRLQYKVQKTNNFNHNNNKFNKIMLIMYNTKLVVKILII